MNAYVLKDSAEFYNVRFRSYNTDILYIDEKNDIMRARDYNSSDSGDHKSTTTQKQVTIFLREFYGEKWLQAYKAAIKFYRRYNVKKDLAKWFYIQREKCGAFHITFENCIFGDCKIEFWHN